MLAALVRSGLPHRLKPGDLVGALVLSSGAVTNRIDRVEAAGLVERLPDPDDRRGTLVALTDKGRQVVDEAVVAHLANEERLLTALSARERAQLSDLLRKLLVSGPFAGLDPTRSPDHDSRVTDPPGSTADDGSDESPKAERDPRCEQTEHELAGPGEQGATSGEQGDEGTDCEQADRGEADGGDDRGRASGE